MNVRCCLFGVLFLVFGKALRACAVRARANRNDSTRTSRKRLYDAEQFARERRYARAIRERLRVPVGATSQVAVSACRLVNASEVGLVPE